MNTFGEKKTHVQHVSPPLPAKSSERAKKLGEQAKRPMDKKLGEQAKRPMDKKLGEQAKRPMDKKLGEQAKCPIDKKWSANTMQGFMAAS
ncbi:MAG: hypothetical protein RBU37_25950 [Myxococcota bacterium]|nr:hypothetical protein [Myxococcota bacterium]